MLEKLKEINDKYSITTNILIFFTIVTVNFSSYIYYYDANLINIIDTNSIIRFTITLILPFVLISAVIIILLTYFNAYFLTSIYDVFRINTEKRIKCSNFFNNYFLRLSISIFLFSIYYIGISFTLIFLIIIIFYSIIVIIFDKAPFDIISSLFNNTMIFKLLLIKKEDLFQMCISKAGVLLILTSLLLGFFRAAHIENNQIVNINNSLDTYTLILTTSNGICLFKNSDVDIKFIPWDKIDNLNFNFQNKNTWNKLSLFNNDDEVYKLKKYFSIEKK